jgi:hypothetical protein
MKTYQQALKEHKVEVFKSFRNTINLGTPEGDARYWIGEAIFKELVAAMAREGISPRAFNKEMKAFAKECAIINGKE